MVDLPNGTTGFRKGTYRMTKRLLILEDGTIFEGTAIGADIDTIGELVFTTGMTGYQETISDQSFNGQIILFTYTLIGNYGINRDDSESIQPSCKGVIVSEASRLASNWRNEMSLHDFLVYKKIPGISGVDTRALTKIIRKNGTMKATIVNGGDSLEHIMDQFRATVLPSNQIELVSTKKAYVVPGVGKKVILVDFGVKESILKELVRRSCHVTVLPFDATAEEILKEHPDGVILSNGPGDPKSQMAALDMIRSIQGKVPLFGICMGHQLFCLANGADTYKMTFGHRGMNHAVREIATGKVDFTSQNHGYAVDRKSLPTSLLITHEDINDLSIEGVKHKDYPAFSVQFHPEASPGPHDTTYLFDDFIEMMEVFKENQKSSLERK